MKKKSYIYAVGRRKKAIAQVKLHKGGTGKITVNNQECAKYFPGLELQQTVKIALESIGQAEKLDLEARVLGGGKYGQAEAIRQGAAKALVELNPNFRRNLKKAGYLTRDPRRRERKKPGLKRARRAPQWAKR